MIGRRHDYAGFWATGFVSPSVYVPAAPQLTAHALGACVVLPKLRDYPPGTKILPLWPAPFWVRHVTSIYRYGWQHLPPSYTIEK